MRSCDFEELKHDFNKAVAHIDFKEYDPYSRAFMKALFIGQMYMVAKCICEEDDISEELDGAEKYWDMYLKSNDSQYKEMAHDELKHAGILIKMRYKNADEKTKEVLEEYENSRQQLLSSLDKEV